MSKTYKSVFYVLRRWGIIALLVFLVSAVNFKLQPASERIYKGVSQITQAQFFSMNSPMTLDEALNTQGAKVNYTLNKDGTVQLTYNFISTQNYSFLKSKNLTFWNMFPINAFTPNALNNSYVVLMILFLFVLVILNAYRAKNPQKYNETTTKTRHWLEGLADNSVKPPLIHDVTTKVSDVIVRDYKGIIAVRVWKIEKGKLKSVVQDTVWDKNTFNADSKNLKENGVEGIYAYRIGSLMRYSGIVMGIVEMQGQYYYHSDIIRAENCVIKCLFMSKGRTNLAKVLSNRYNVKVLLGDRKEQAYTDWLFSQNGLECMEHNQKLLEDEDGSRTQSQETGIRTLPETSGSS